MMLKMKKFKFWLPPIIWASLIFLFSSLPTIQTSEIYWQDFILKKTAHIVEYGIFAALLYRATKNSGVSKSRAAIYSILIAALYGVTDEIHQSFTPGREPRLRDVLIDTAGAGLFIYFLWRLLPQAPEKLKIWAKRWEIL